jgi:hypothetical protein
LSIIGSFIGGTGAIVVGELLLRLLHLTLETEVAARLGFPRA